MEITGDVCWQTNEPRIPEENNGGKGTEGEEKGASREVGYERGSLDMGALNLRKESTGGFIAGKKERVEGGEGGTGRGGDEEREKKGKKKKGERRRRFNQSTKT